MTNSRSTKRALYSSVIALLVCFAMLIGTTYAWFTDSATSANNVIKTGTLDVELYQWNGVVTDDRANAVAMGTESPAVFPGDIKWEPGYTHVVYLSIKNNGDLSLKYKVALEVTQVSDKSLLDVMSYAVSPDAQFGSVTSWAGNGTYLEGRYTEDKDAQDVELKAGEEHFFALSVHMDEEASNKYMNQSVTFDVVVLAGQLADETDGTGSNQYDKFAGYPGTGYAPAITGNASAASVLITDKEGYKIGSAIIPKDAADPNAEGYKVNVIESDYKANVTVAAGLETIPYEVTVEGLKDGNTKPVKIQLRIKEGLDPTTVKLYHYDTEIDCTYDPNTGYVTFESATFSPFTIVCDLESEYVFPEVPKDEEGNVKYPKATVTPYTNTSNIEWGDYGQWSPAEGLEANLDAAFTFACPTDLPEDIRAAYENWYCDFFVSLDTDLGTNEIFLGGNYGSFGWIGFHNGDLTLPANYDLPLLCSVTTNPWTYASIESQVGEFICGVGNVGNSLEGATFTVKLRLINPEHESVVSAMNDDATRGEWWAHISEDAYIDVNVVTYTFGGNAVIDGVLVE